jgi:hypothetical protein
MGVPRSDIVRRVQVVAKFVRQRRSVLSTRDNPHCGNVGSGELTIGQAVSGTFLAISNNVHSHRPVGIAAIQPGRPTSGRPPHQSKVYISL